mgnify:CR=1 FL=1
MWSVNVIIIKSHGMWVLQLVSLITYLGECYILLKDVLGMIYMDFTVDVEEVISLPKGRLVFSRINDSMIRIVFNGDLQIPPKTVGVSRNSSISLRPIPPSGNLLKVDYLFIKLNEPVTVLPKESVEIYFKLPVDIGVYVNNYLIHTVPTVKVKYALYGPPDLGHLCRYVDGGLINSVPDNLLGITKLVINNQSSDVGTVGKVVAPLNGLQIYLTASNDLIFNTIYVRLADSLHAEVTTKLIPSKHVENLKYLFKGIESAYVMKYGV